MSDLSLVTLYPSIPLEYPDMSSQLVWLITGTSCVHLHVSSTIFTSVFRTGFGRELALAALERGERVIATARASSVNKLDDLKEKGAAVIELDVTAALDALKSIAREAIGIYGQVDVLVNNAGMHASFDFSKPAKALEGYIQSGTIEESTPEETLSQFKYGASAI